MKKIEYNFSYYQKQYMLLTSKNSGCTALNCNNYVKCNADVKCNNFLKWNVITDVKCNKNDANCIK